MHGTTSRVDPKINEQSAIKARLLEAAITLADIDRKYGLLDGTARNTMREPNTQGECAIAPALGQTTSVVEDPLQAVRSTTIAPGLDTCLDAEATPKQPG